MPTLCFTHCSPVNAILTNPQPNPRALDGPSIKIGYMITSLDQGASQPSSVCKAKTKINRQQ